MSDSDPYRVLGVAKDASDAEIKRAYRKLARQYHPDRNDDAAAEERFKRIQSAHEQIGTPEDRAKFDQEQQMRNMFGGGGGNPFSGMGGGGGNVRFDFGGGGMGGMEDMLQGLFGGGMGEARGASPFAGHDPRGARQSQTQPERGANINAHLDLSLTQASQGGSFPFTIRRLTSDNTGGVQSKQKSLSVKIKAGIEHATVMRLSGMGHEHPRGEAGDILLTIRIDPEEGRRWEDFTLVQVVEIPYSTLVLGGKVRITTPDGKSGNLTIPENSRIGDRRRMKGKGYNGGELDLEFVLAETEGLSQEQRQAIAALRDLGL